MRPFCFLFILISSLPSPHYACNQLDHDSLMSFLHSISSTAATPLRWSFPNCCLWEGIECDSNVRVTQIQLPFRGLKGSLSPSLGNLTHLSHLNLSHNWLSGPLPKEFFRSITHLTTLDLSFNVLSGEIPLSLSFPSSIQVADISSNHFSGMVRTSFVQMASNLMIFNVSNNSFTGPIPTSICTISNHTRVLDFSSNDFNDQLPRGFGRCYALEVLRAGFNNLSGLLPSDIYNVTTLREISFPVNRLRGPIGGGVVQLSNLTILHLHSNKMSGLLPRDLGKLSKLEQLDLHSNSLTGSLTPSLMNCRNLITLSLRENFLEGDISTLDFSMLKQLRTLDLSNNHFRGNIPEGLYLCKSLIAVRLANNQLEGQISPGMLTLQSLSYIALSNNRLANMTGAINILRGCKNLRVVILAKNFFGEMLPDDKHILDINSFKKLKVLALGGCSLRGQLPRWIAEITELEILDLSYNRISGSIPGWLGTLPKLFYIDLSVNLLSGKFPQELCTLPALTSEHIALQVNQNYLELPIFVQPTGRTNLAYVHLSHMPPAIYLGSNSLNGDIPTTIGQLKFLHVLDLSNNSFSGIIPYQISYLRNLEKLDLSWNNLSGEIPVSLRSLYFLSSFSVAHNALEGMIPSGTQLQSFPDSSYEGNPGLCGFVYQRKCLPVTSFNNQRDVQGENGLQIPRLYVAVGLGYATGFVAVCTTLLFHSPWRHAYFSALIHLKDNVYVIIAMNMARLQRRR